MALTVLFAPKLLDSGSVLVICGEARKAGEKFATARGTAGLPRVRAGGGTKAVDPEIVGPNGVDQRVIGRLETARRS